MLLKLFIKLDRLVHEENLERRNLGTFEINSSEIKIVGQMALMEAGLDLNLAATQDVDAFVKADYWVQKRFENLLVEIHKVYDDESEFIWMPAETAYRVLFAGKWVTAKVAEPEYVLVSKALKAPRKNKNLIVEYLAKGASPRFWELAQKYCLDLDGILNNG